MTNRILRLAAVVVCTLGLAVAPTLAQHSHGAGAGGPGTGGAGGPHGPAMGRGSDNASMGGSSARGSASSPSSVLDRNTKLDSKLTSKLQAKGLLPAGTDLKDACAGFRNLGQCMAAIHVSHNLKIPFDCLKADMTGTAAAQGSTCPAGTGSSKMSLGKSIQTLSPNADSKTEAKNGAKQADADLKEAESDSSS